MVAYNVSREQLLLQHVQALTNLDTIYLYRVKKLLPLMVNMDNAQINEFIFTNLPGLTKPFQQTAAQIGARFYEMRREQAQNFTGKTAPKLALTAMDLIPADLSKDLMGSLTATVIKGRDSGNILGIADRFALAAASPIAQADREAITEMVEADNWVTSSTPQVRAARPDGCPFCKKIAFEVGNSIIENDLKDFHNGCKCVIDANFEGEIKFRQAFYGDFQQDYNKAKTLIENGEAGERIVQVGSKEWKTQIEKDLNKKARDWRKDFEVTRNLNTEQKKNQRNSTSQMVDTITGKISKGENLTDKENNILQQWDYPAENLTKPLRKPIDNFNNNNMVAALDIVQGRRRVIE